MKTFLSFALIFVAGVAIGLLVKIPQRPQVGRYTLAPINSSSLIGVYRIDTSSGALEVAVISGKSGWKIYSVDEAARANSPVNPFDQFDSPPKKSSNP